MVICYLFARRNGRFLLSYDNLFKDVYTKSIPRKIKYNESKEQQKIFSIHIKKKDILMQSGQLARLYRLEKL